MPILNYTTKISADKTCAEIQAKLGKVGAQAVLCEYENGIVTHISFQVNSVHGLLSFRLPANIDKVFCALRKAKISNGYKTKEQAARVAWRIIKDWIEAQLAIIEAEMASISEVFLPYMQTPTGETVYEKFTGGTLLLTSGGLGE